MAQAALMGVGAIGSIVGGVQARNAANAQAEAQSQLGEAQLKMREQDAAFGLAQSSYEQRDQVRKGEAVMGEAIATSAASGAGVPVHMLAKLNAEQEFHLKLSDRVAENERRRAMYNAKLEQAGVEMQATATRTQGQAAFLSGVSSGISGLAGAAGKIG